MNIEEVSRLQIAIPRLASFVARRCMEELEGAENPPGTVVMTKKIESAPLDGNRRLLIIMEMRVVNT